MLHTHIALSTILQWLVQRQAYIRVYKYHLRNSMTGCCNNAESEHRDRLHFRQLGDAVAIQTTRSWHIPDISVDGIYILGTTYCCQTSSVTLHIHRKVEAHFAETQTDRQTDRLRISQTIPDNVSTRNGCIVFKQTDQQTPQTCAPMKWSLCTYLMSSNAGCSRSSPAVKKMHCCQCCSRTSQQV